MKTIQPIQCWVNGGLVEATLFLLNIAYDNLLDTANFNYGIYYIDNKNMVQIAYTSALQMSGEDYQTWDAQPSANEWAYTWAASKLKITITGDYIPPAPSATEEAPVVDQPITE